MMFRSLLCSNAHGGKRVVSGCKHSVIALPRIFAVSALLLPALLLGSLSAATTLGQGQPSRAQTDQTDSQRLTIMRSKLDAMRKSLNSAIAAIPAKEASDKSKNKPANPDDPRERLRGLEKEVGSVLSDVNDLSSKQDHAEKYDTSKIDGLETSVAELSTRVQTALQSTASARTGDPATASNYHPKQEKGKKRLLGLLGHSGGSDKYAELTSGAVAPGRDRELFEDAAKEVRKGNYDTGRLLFNTIVTAYPDSPYLPMAKLAIADSFYLEGSTSSLIQAGQAYQDWLTFFPTDPLADAAMLRVAEAEMRQMGLPDRQYQHSIKAEQRLKALLQQYPQTKLRPEVEAHLREVQDNLAMHDKGVGDFYMQRYEHKGGGLKGAQNRYKEIVEKYPNFCLMDDVLFRLGATYQEEEEPDEAAKFYQRVVREFPESDFVGKAKDQLNIIGAPIPEPDPARAGMPNCDKPTFVQNFMQQLTGTPNITTNHDGILITRHGKGDLIDAAIQNNGQLPQPVIDRTVRTQAPAVTQPAPNQTPEMALDKKDDGGSTQPSGSATRPRTTQPGPVPSPTVKPPSKP